MFEHTFTVPDPKSIFFNQIKNLVMNYAESFNEIPTKDGLVFSVEFSSELKKHTFIAELNDRFPFTH